MVERLKLQSKRGTTFDMYDYMDACTLDMVCGEYDTDDGTAATDSKLIFLELLTRGHYGNGNEYSDG